VDFSRAMIFLTSNLGASEMESLVRPKLGFAAADGARPPAAAGRLSRAGLDAARRTFSPEFINRIDKTVVFSALGEPELRGILDLELESVRERMSRATNELIGFTVSGAAQNLLLAEGIDSRYGARYLKRAIERLLVQPLSNLMASGQIQAGDSLLVDLDPVTSRLIFLKEKKEVTAPGAAEKSMAA
jgi:ATP-dependent Clp protease ATP-binding subunit ClpA